jgi:hypothetical protein
MHTYQEKGEILAQEPYSKAQKTVPLKQQAALDLGGFKQF